MGALSESACRVAGEIADGVLLNWLTPEHARRSAESIAEGAAKAGRRRRRPELYAYVRVALGDDACARIEVEGARCAAGATYGPHFERMHAEPVDTAIPATSPDEIPERLAAWDGVVDEVVMRFPPGDAAAHLEILRAAPVARPDVAALLYLLK